MHTESVMLYLNCNLFIIECIAYDKSGFNKYYRQGFWYFAEKKGKFRGIFRGKFTEKSANFAGKKSKFVEKSADSEGFSREKSQNSPEKHLILQDFSGKKSNIEGFSGANS